jgi:pyruvate/2-oxoglutarate/acetoin dehydrogenase E1 component
VVYIDECWLYDHKGDMLAEMYTLAIGKGVLRREGKDVTIVATSYMVFKTMRAAEILEKEGVDTEVIDLRTLKPLDEPSIFGSVKKTSGMVADSGWKSFGVGAEIITRVMESDVFGCLRIPVGRASVTDIQAPASSALEK